MSRESYTQQEIDDALTALIAHAGNASAAIRYLEGEEKRAPGYATLLKWSRITHWERYEQLREQLAPKVENMLANDYLETAVVAARGARLAAEIAVERLEKGNDPDPGRTAANLGKLSQSSTDKRLSLQGRPTKITENRDASQILRSLIAAHPQVFGLTEAPDELEAGDE